MSLRLFVALFVCLACGPVSARQSSSPGTNGTILSHKPCEWRQYEQQSSFTKTFYSKEEYDRAKSNGRVECFRVEYWSDGPKVVGYLVRPVNPRSARFPVIIFNRGGFLDLGKIQTFNLIDFERLSEQGFVVLASQYRGNDGGEGHEELGGKDLDDISNLAEMAKSLPYTDGKNIFMYGVSRGGMMTFLEMKRNFQINAAAVVGAVYDLAAFRERAPGIVEEAAKLIPDYRERDISALQDRSVMDWPERVNVPLLMIHGADDEEVPVTEALEFAIKLSKLKKPYELIVYPNDVHEAAKNREDRDNRIANWFKSYIR